MKRKLMFLFMMISVTAMAESDALDLGRAPAVVGEVEYVDVEAVRTQLASTTDRLQKVQEALKGLGRGPSSGSCFGCEDPEKIIVLKDKEQKLEALLGKGVQSFILKRDSASPKKIELSFKNAEGQSCFDGGRVVVLEKGVLHTGCMLPKTNIVERILLIDFSRLPTLRDGEEDFFELKIVKEDVREKPFTPDLSSISDPDQKVSIEKASVFSSADFKLTVRPKGPGGSDE